ncbi:hypothetical protein NST41_28475 [Paenibacillus sp. FSL L8-0696]|uniref:hypothetical protein n=1 Tax=Paenibacillus sp. FSL L8-0696 TaxID=2954524 RepID=UPI00311A1405
MRKFENAPIDNLSMAEDQKTIMGICEQLKSKKVTTDDMNRLLEITQINHDVFSTFQLSLILRVSIVLLEGSGLKNLCEYIHENVMGAYGFIED